MNYFLLSKPRLALFLPLILFVTFHANSQEQPRKTTFEVYGFIKTDVVYNFNQIDPNWFDVLRVTKLPQYKDQFAPDGKIYFSVRQTRVGLRSWSNTPLGQLKMNFEFDLFGVGPNVGQTTFRFRKAFAELGRFTVGQTESLFTDVNVTPNTLDFGAPPSRAFLRTIQVRYMHVREHYRWGIALEQPGATSDEGIYANRLELENVRAEFKVPDVSAEYRRIFGRGYVELAGVVKWIRWEDIGNGPINLSGNSTAWGFNISSLLHLGQNTLFKGQLVYGEGIQSHLTDAGPDVGIINNFDNPITPVLGVSLPVVGGLAFLEHNWTSKWISTAGYSHVRIYNSEAQAPDAFRNGNYAILNLIYKPFPQYLMGAELQWGERNNFRDDFTSSAVRLQISFKYNFSHALYEDKNK